MNIKIIFLLLFTPLRPSNLNTILEEVCKICDLFQRPFTILDLTNLSLTQELLKQRQYNCCYVWVGKKNTPQINHPNFLTLNTLLSTRDIFCLTQCEDLDVVLVSPNIYAKLIPSHLKNLLELGMTTILIKSANKLNVPKMAVINSIQENNSCIIVQRKNKVLRRGWFNGSRKNFLIHNNFNEKYFIKNNERIDWHKGINLWTFLVLNGTYPSKKHIEQELYKNFDLEKLDYTPWNIIIQGQNIIPIDQEAIPNFPYNTENKLCIFRKTLYLLYHPAKNKWCYPLEQFTDTPKINNNFFQNSNKPDFSMNIKERNIK